jgi:hypothetical protein
VASAKCYTLACAKDMQTLSVCWCCFESWHDGRNGSTPIQDTCFGTTWWICTFPCRFSCATAGCILGGCLDCSIWPIRTIARASGCPLCADNSPKYPYPEHSSKECLAITQREADGKTHVVSVFLFFLTIFCFFSLRYFVSPFHTHILPTIFQIAYRC